MSRQPPLRVGLIGCGGIAVSAHVPALQQLRSLVEVASVSDIRPPAAESVARTLGCDWTADYRVLLDDASIDAVIICTPEFAHAEQAVAAAVERLRQLRPGERVELRSRRDPCPVWERMDELAPRRYGFVYLEDGPDHWQVRVTRRERD